MSKATKSAAAEQTEKKAAIDKRAWPIVAEAINTPEPTSRMIAVAVENVRKRILFACIVYLGALAGAEAVSVLLAPTWGIIFYFAILFTMVYSFAVIGEHGSQRLLLALGLAPLIRIVSLSMPLTEFSQIYWYLLTSIPVLAGVIAVIKTLGLRPSEVGLMVRAIPLQILVASAGIFFGLVAYLILKPEPLISGLNWQEIILPALIFLVAAGFVEELAFRGVMQRSAQALGSWGWIYIAVLYSMLQIGQLSVQYWSFVLLAAVFFGWIVKRTGSILGVGLSHGLLNIGMYLIFPSVL